MKSFIESKIVDFKSGKMEGPVVHHFAFAHNADKRAIEAMHGLVATGLASVSDTEAEDGSPGYIYSWYSMLPIEKSPSAKVELDFSGTGNGASTCYECGANFTPANPCEMVSVGDYVPCECPKCHSRSASPVVTFDMGKARRRIEDHLRKNQEDIFRVAHLLGINVL